MLVNTVVNGQRDRAGRKWARASSEAITGQWGRVWEQGEPALPLVSRSSGAGTLLQGRKAPLEAWAAAPRSAASCTPRLSLELTGEVRAAEAPGGQGLPAATCWGRVWSPVCGTQAWGRPCRGEAGVPREHPCPKGLADPGVGTGSAPPGATLA